MKRLLTLIAAIVGLLIVANMIMAMRVGSRLNAQKAAVRAAGAPASIAELKPPPIAVNLNAAAQLEAVAFQIDAFGSEHGAFYRTDLGKAYAETEGQVQPLSADYAAAMRAIVDKHAGLLDAVVRAAACERWAPRADFSVDHTRFLDDLMDDTADFRTVARLLDWQIRLLVHDKKFDDATKYGIAELRLARLHESAPTLMSYLVSVAVRGVAIRRLSAVLAAGPVPAETRAALDAELGRADAPQSFELMLITERAAAFDAMEPIAGRAPPMMMRMFGWAATRQILGAYDLLDAVIAESNKPWQEFRKMARPGGLLAGPTPFGIMGDSFAPAIVAAVDARDRDLALLRSLRVLSAVQGFAEANGRKASGLADLGLPAAATIDPYSGAPLILKHADKGRMVYGLGKNGQDDGGDFEEWLDVGVGAARKTDGD